MDFHRNPPILAKRHSNMELLRIVAMLMILTLHTRYDGILSVYDGTIDASHIARFFFESISTVGVNLFVFISGYFGIKLRKASVANLAFQVYYFAIIAFIGSCLLNGSLHVGSAGYLKLLFPLSHNVWFVPCYFILMLLSPILNSFIEGKTAKQLALYTLGLYAIAFVWTDIWGCVDGFSGYSWGFFIILYMTGATIRKWATNHSLRKSYCLLGYIMCSTLTIVLALVQSRVPIGQSLIWVHDFPIVYVSSICLFLFFVQLKIGSSKMINAIAASSFAVLLFHMSACSQYKVVCQYIYEHFDGVVVIVLTACAVVGYYAISMLLDQPRKFFCKFVKDKI